MNENLSDILMNEEGARAFGIVFTNFNQLRGVLSESDSKKFSETESRYDTLKTIAESETDFTKKTVIYKALIDLYQAALDNINEENQ